MLKVLNGPDTLNSRVGENKSKALFDVNETDSTHSNVEKIQSPAEPPHSISSVAAEATSAATTFVADRRSGHHLPMALTRPERRLATMAACLAIAMLIVITFLALKIQQLRARARRWESVGNNRDLLLERPSGRTEYEVKEKELLNDAAEPAHARDTQAGNIVSVDVTTLVVEGTSVEERN
ncbi:hypothetical protein IW262DRAFT_1291185 [Armillaria fumosa]|nr:hypothetical protein IW262DRAFT_1291185 [Armillaria fumosa]